VSKTLYVSNLPLSATEDVLAGKFGNFGTVVSVKLDRDASTQVSRRGAFVEMQTAADAQKAINGLNFADFDGRLMSVYKAAAVAAVTH
jgi:RNA recognition motif-containing protein